MFQIPGINQLRTPLRRPRQLNCFAPQKLVQPVQQPVQAVCTDPIIVNNLRFKPTNRKLFG